jgi:hypothetical protein
MHERFSLLPESIRMDLMSEHAAIDEAVEQLLRRFPDFVFKRGALVAYHGVGRLAWGLRAAGRRSGDNRSRYDRHGG